MINRIPTFIAIIALLLCGHTSRAQDLTEDKQKQAPGPWSVSGQVYFLKSNSSSPIFFSTPVINSSTRDVSRLTLSPELNYGFKNNKTTLAMGFGWITGKETGSAFFSGQPFSSLRDYESRVSGFSVDLGVEHYLFQNNTFAFLLGFGPSFSYQKTTTDLAELQLSTLEVISAQTIITKNASFGIGAAPGIDLFLSPRWTINLTFGSVGYNRFSQQVDNGEVESVYSFVFNINPGSLGLGVEYQL